MFSTLTTPVPTSGCARDVQHVRGEMVKKGWYDYPATPGQGAFAGFGRAYVASSPTEDLGMGLGMGMGMGTAMGMEEDGRVYEGVRAEAEEQKRGMVLRMDTGSTDDGGTYKGKGRGQGGSKSRMDTGSTDDEREYKGEGRGQGGPKLRMDTGSTADGREYMGEGREQGDVLLRMMTGSTSAASPLPEEMAYEGELRGDGVVMRMTTSSSSVPSPSPVFGALQIPAADQRTTRPNRRPTNPSEHPSDEDATGSTVTHERTSTNTSDGSQSTQPSQATPQYQVGPALLTESANPALTSNSASSFENDRSPRSPYTAPSSLPVWLVPAPTPPAVQTPSSYFGAPAEVVVSPERFTPAVTQFVGFPPPDTAHEISEGLKEGAAGMADEQGEDEDGMRVDGAEEMAEVVINRQARQQNRVVSDDSTISARTIMPREQAMLSATVTPAMRATQAVVPETTEGYQYRCVYVFCVFVHLRLPTLPAILKHAFPPSTSIQFIPDHLSTSCPPPTTSLLCSPILKGSTNPPRLIPQMSHKLQHSPSAPYSQLHFYSAFPIAVPVHPARVQNQGADMEFLIFSPPSTSAPTFPAHPPQPPYPATQHHADDPRKQPISGTHCYGAPQPQHQQTYDPTSPPPPPFDISRFAFNPALPSLADSAAYPLPVVTPARTRARAHDSTGVAGSRPGVSPGDGLRAMRDLEEDLAVNVGLDVDDWADVLRRWFLPPARLTLTLTSTTEEIRQFNINAQMLAPFFWSLQNNRLTAQSLRLSETRETAIIFDTPLSSADASRGDSREDRGVQLQADDFRWRFGYKDGEVLEWEGTVEVVWAVTGGVEGGRGHGSGGEGGGGGAGAERLMIERLEVVVHEWKAGVGSTEVDKENWGWGIPEDDFEVLEMIEASEHFEPVRALAEDEELGFDVALERLLGKYEDGETYLGEGNEDGDSVMSEDKMEEVDFGMEGGAGEGDA
ncbi:uncharacterized protein MKK02DRAFT_39303 [Dioszegia hungarica]|uniref:Uncharacterized protein n=1 Tax=Dioszegia hungarica TaxID=4972 RepID=A0AA38H3C8_9TREE|nr:uncharacterized protein MKK02DRAFT_39303 [Dioszegia hungarica]KAI9633323.1 hypothetical protein MKK02DRAFT_39303 [Dioszegia hungarica]